eukprot:CAMPEP_0198286262 /NCGR_PEP_ID=MMETSP1449-20131203/5387_1 /TAXON_ID=420275 /ORGANISM="Attheya septentrionalis, Strain CCMP2084" /LENGTH=411 /DNA_ID=CAMNT_0043983951 /DNA_START=120 /DNA_END=1355 /DNA_ORIENTATION=-
MTVLSVVVGILAVGFGGIVMSGGPMTGVTPPLVPEDSPTHGSPPWPVFQVVMKLHNLFAYLARVTIPPNLHVMNVATSYWQSEVLYSLTYNGILQYLVDENSLKSCADVASSLHLQEMVVCEYMKAGEHLGFLQSTDNGSNYGLTEAGKLSTGGMKDWILFINEETKDAWRAAGTESIRTGVSGFQSHFGLELFAWHNEHPDKEAQFDGAMTSLGPAAVGALLSGWSPPALSSTVCDIGSGVGTLVAEILQHYPEAKGMTLDQPSVSERATVYMEEKGLGHRAQVFGSSFFDPFPPEMATCDVFFMRFILHDWGDDDCIVILKQIKQAASGHKNGNKVKLAIMEQVTDTNAGAAMERAKSLMSINMIASCSFGARERTMEEYAQLFAAAGYSGAPKLIKLREIFSVLEVEI